MRLIVERALVVLDGPKRRRMRPALHLGNVSSRALVKGIAGALEARDCSRVGVAGANVQLFAILAGLVRLQEARIGIRALVDGSGRAEQARGREDAQSRRDQSAKTHW
jgi:hypothetical protein